MKMNSLSKEAKDKIKKSIKSAIISGAAACIAATSLINTFEEALNVHIIYSDETRVDLNKDAIQYYVETQNKFFEAIAQDSNVSFDEIADQFNNYSLVVKTGDHEYTRNYSFSWLDTDEKNFVGYLLTDNIQSLTYNIRNIEYLDLTNTVA